MIDLNAKGADLRDQLLTDVEQAIARAFQEFGDKRVIQNAAIANAVGVVADFFDSIYIGDEDEIEGNE